MIRLLAVLLALTFASPAAAHAIKVFAAAGTDSVTGYAFFVGGGRAKGAAWSASDEADKEFASGKTDSSGGFEVAVPAGIATVTVTVNTGEGHVGAASVQMLDRSGSGTAQVDPALIEAAVARAVAPLEAQITEMRARMRFTDMLSSLFLIAGLAGMALWALGRRK